MKWISFRGSPGLHQLLPPHFTAGLQEEEISLILCWRVPSHVLAFTPTEKDCHSVAQSCLTLCDPLDCSPPGSSVQWGFSRQEYWSRLSCPPPGDLPNPGNEPRSPTLQEDSLLDAPPGKGKDYWSPKCGGLSSGELTSQLNPHQPLSSSQAQALPSFVLPGLPSLTRVPQKPGAGLSAANPHLDIDARHHLAPWRERVWGVGNQPTSHRCILENQAWSEFGLSPMLRCTDYLFLCFGFLVYKMGTVVLFSQSVLMWGWKGENAFGKTSRPAPGIR